MHKHVLIVDSEIKFSISIKRALESTDAYLVRTVTRLTPAVNALQEVAYHVAVINLMLDQATPEEVVAGLRNLQPEIPVILTSPFYDDTSYLLPLNAQAFIVKPYKARELIPILEETIARGYFEHIQETRANPIRELDDAHAMALIQNMLDHTHRTPGPGWQEPPPSLYDSSIGEVIDNSLNPEVSRRITAVPEPLTLPDAPTALLPHPTDAPGQDDWADVADDGWETDRQNFPVSATLANLSEPARLEAILEQISAAQEVQEVPAAPAPSAEEDSAPSFVRDLLAELPAPEAFNGSLDLDPLPLDSETEYFLRVPPAHLPDQAFIDQLPGSMTPATPPQAPPAVDWDDDPDQAEGD
ncbi:MAG: response regulator, partial [Anaerolineae bacterium]|nr:response regulator [Anaerolineae bacterium]